MVVNYVDVALALIIVAYIISGWKRGFFITVLNFVRYAFGFALCFYISDNSAQAVYDDYVKERALERINEKIVTSDKAPQLLENLQQAVNALPKDIAGSLDISSVNLSSKNVSQEILDNLFKPILMFLTQAALFVAVFIVFFGATAVIMYYVKRAKKRRHKKEKKAVVTRADCFFGALFGALKAALAVCAIAAVSAYALSLFGDSASNQFIVNLKSSEILSWFNNKNIFNLITSF